MWRLENHALRAIVGNHRFILTAGSGGSIRIKYDLVAVAREKSRRKKNRRLVGDGEHLGGAAVIFDRSSLAPVAIPVLSVSGSGQRGPLAGEGGDQLLVWVGELGGSLAHQRVFELLHVDLALQLVDDALGR